MLRAFRRANPKSQHEQTWSQLGSYNLGRQTTSLWMNSHAKIASDFGKQKDFAYTIHISFSISTHTVPFGVMLGSFGIQVGGFGGPSWRLGAFLGLMLGLTRRKWEPGRPRGHRERVGKGLGWLRVGWGPRSGPNMDPI